MEESIVKYGSVELCICFVGTMQIKYVGTMLNYVEIKLCCGTMLELCLTVLELCWTMDTQV